MTTWFLDEIESWEIIVFGIGVLLMIVGLVGFFGTGSIFPMLLFGIGFLLAAFGVVYSGILTGLYSEAMDA